MELQIRNVCKRFGDKEVLKDVSLTARSGSALGILGRNGAGKTTTIRIIMGVFFADSGEVLVDGKPIDRDRISIGYMPEERGLYPKKLISEQLIYLAELRGMSPRDAKQACSKWLDRMGMSEYKNKKLETLSKGNQQKIQLCATLMCDPQIIILDEPFSGLDPVNAMLLKDVIKEMIDGGAVVLFSSHQMNYIEEFCSSITILNSGKIVLDGKIGEIKRSYPRDTMLVSASDFEKIPPYLLKNNADIILSADKDTLLENTVKVRLKSAKNKAALLESLSASGIDIDRFEVYEPSLNDIFVEYTEAGI